MVGGCASQIGHIVDYASQVYRDRAGWLVSVPHGWHMVRFSQSRRGVASAGVQISNVRLPPPRLVRGYPIQVNDRVLPARGVALIVATDTERFSQGMAARLPLPSLAKWLHGSALGGEPYMEIQRFRANGRRFIADAKVGAKASRTDTATLAWIVHSLRMGVRDARVFGVGRSCGGPANVCGGIAGTVFARNASGRVVAAQRLVKDRYSFLLAPGRYRLVLRFEKGGSLTNTVVARAQRSVRSDFFIGFP